jgi:RNA polymerase sigma factor (sigma-70 family)
MQTEARNPMMVVAEIVSEAGETQCLLEFRGGSEAAFEALFRKYQREVFGWVLRIVRDQGAAEDLTIETFFRIHRAHARFDAAREFGPWARRIATRQRPEHVMAEEFFTAQPAQSTGDPAGTAEIRRHVAGALRRLPPKLRVAAMLAVIEERPQKEVADALGITVAAVKLRVFRAMRRLRSDLEQKGITP